MSFFPDPLSIYNIRIIACKPQQYHLTTAAMTTDNPCVHLTSLRVRFGIIGDSIKRRHRAIGTPAAAAAVRKTSQLEPSTAVKFRLHIASGAHPSVPDDRAIMESKRPPAVRTAETGREAPKDERYTGSCCSARKKFRRRRGLDRAPACWWLPD